VGENTERFNWKNNTGTLETVVISQPKKEVSFMVLEKSVHKGCKGLESKDRQVMLDA